MVAHSRVPGTRGWACIQDRSRCLRRDPNKVRIYILQDGGPTCIDRADKILVLREEVRQTNAPEDGEEPCAEEPLPCLLWRNLNERGPSKGDTAEIGKDIVCDDHGDWQNEPDEALKDVVDDKVRLSDNEEQSHVSPGELGELKLVVSFLQGEDEEDEAWHSLIRGAMMLWKRD
jgi:hypothetical protein